MPVRISKKVGGILWQTFLFFISIAGGADYEEFSAEAFDVFLAFEDDTRRQSFDVTIIDDELFENTEDFDLELRFDPFVRPPSGVILRPNVSTICILDDDGNDYSQSIHVPYFDNMQYTEVIIGFINPPYSVIENEGQVVIRVGVIEGSLRREVVVSFSTSDNTAIGKRTI